jgi:hypothetical protein
MKLAPFAFLPLALAAALPAHAAPATGTFACGGIGADQRRALAERAEGANLALEFFVAGHGDFVSGADVALVPLDAAAGSDVLHVTADGPICYGRVPPGHYRVEASLNGARRSAQATVPVGTSTPVRVAIAFPAAAAPGDLDLRPTPEEKQEARTP